MGAEKVVVLPLHFLPKLGGRTEIVRRGHFLFKGQRYDFIRPWDLTSHVAAAHMDRPAPLMKILQVGQMKMKDMRGGGGGKQHLLAHGCSFPSVSSAFPR